MAKVGVTLIGKANIVKAVCTTGPTVIWTLNIEDMASHQETDLGED